LELREVQFLVMLIRFMECKGWLPQKLGPEGRKLWRIYVVYLRWGDLLEMAARDLIRTFPVFQALPQALRIKDINELRALEDKELFQIMEAFDDMDLEEEDSKELYLKAAGLLGVEPPQINEDEIQKVSLDRSAQIVELPGGYGYATLVLLNHHPYLSPQHNCYLLAGSPEEALLASWAMALMSEGEEGLGRVNRVTHDGWRSRLPRNVDLFLAPDIPEWINADELKGQFPRAKWI
jgi:hypothetical protein